MLVGSAFLGTVGLDWQFAGVAPVHGPGTSDLVLRNVTSGAFQVYNIANNQITGSASLGQVGLDWQLGGLTANPPAGALGGPRSSCKRWRVSTAPRPACRVPSRLRTTRYSSRC